MLRCSVVLSNKSTKINTTIFADNSKSNITTYFIISSSWSLVMIDKQRKSGIDISHLTYVWRRSDGRKAVHRAIFWIIFVENQSRVMQQHIIPDTKSVYKRRHHSWQKNEVKYLLCSLRKFLCTSWQILVHTTPHTTINHLFYM